MGQWYLLKIDEKLSKWPNGAFSSFLSNLNIPWSEKMANNETIYSQWYPSGISISGTISDKYTLSKKEWTLYK